MYSFHQNVSFSGACAGSSAHWLLVLAQENANDFRVSLDWSDVEEIVRVFCEMNHPEATRLVRARNLAAAIEDFANKGA